MRGLCELGLHRPAEAAATLTTIVKNDPQCPTLDRVLYDLAWAYEDSQRSGRGDWPRSPNSPTRIPRAGSPPSVIFAWAKHNMRPRISPRRPECYYNACDSAPNPELLDRSLHKLAWCCFERGQFGAAEEAFDRQIALQHERIEAAGGKVDPTSPLEPLAADAHADDRRVPVSAASI